MAVVLVHVGLIIALSLLRRRNRSARGLHLPPRDRRRGGGRVPRRRPAAGGSRRGRLARVDADEMLEWMHH